MNSQETLEFAKEEIRKQEPELLIKYTAEMQDRDTICRRKLTPADKIAHSLMDITGMYAQAIKDARGGWICGTHVNHVRTALAHQIASSYDDAQLCSFIDFCAERAGGRKALQHADNDIMSMVEEFLAMRPAPFVHPPSSWWRQVLNDEK